MGPRAGSRGVRWPGGSGGTAGATHGAAAHWAVQESLLGHGSCVADAELLRAFRGGVSPPRPPQAEHHGSSETQAPGGTGRGALVPKPCSSKLGDNRDHGEHADGKPSKSRTQEAKTQESATQAP